MVDAIWNFLLLNFICVGSLFKFNLSVTIKLIDFMNWLYKE